MNYRHTQHGAGKATLYRVVYDTSAVKIFVAVLCAFFLLQGTAPAFASETEPEEAVESAVEAAPEPEPEPEEDNEPEVEEIEEEPEVTEEEDPVEEMEEALQTDDVSEGEVTETTADEATETETIAEEDTTTEGVSTEDEVEITEEVSEETDTATTTETVIDTETELDTATTTDEVVIDAVSEDTATSSTETAGGGGGASNGEGGEVADTAPEVDAGTEGENTTPEDSSQEVTEKNAPESSGERTNTDTEIEAEPEVLGNATTTATTTETAEEVVYVPTPLINDQNRHQFSVDECVSVGDGSFYCNKTNNTGQPGDDEIVFSAPDADGDAEIFFNTGKRTVQLTENLTDDLAPKYDAESNAIVWHRLVDGRYQIVQFNVATGEEVLLTNSRTNNMEPTQEDDVVVWQRWVGDNWEIILFDGENEQQLTDNDVHDLAPDIEGGYVIWHTSGMNGERQVVVYEVATGLLSYIDDNEGGQVTNPRFVLVYDTKFDNGDTITKGFDPETGRLVPLAAQPGDSLPDIPNSDPVGETRALLQNKSQSRDEFIEDTEPTTTPVTPTDNATSTSDVTLGGEGDGEDIIVASSTPSVEETLPLTDFDLIVEPFKATSTQATDSSVGAEIVE